MRETMVRYKWARHDIDFAFPEEKATRSPTSPHSNSGPEATTTISICGNKGYGMNDTTGGGYLLVELKLGRCTGPCETQVR